MRPGRSHRNGFVLLPRTDQDIGHTLALAHDFAARMQRLWPRAAQIVDREIDDLRNRASLARPHQMQHGGIFQKTADHATMDRGQADIADIPFKIRQAE